MPALIQIILSLFLGRFAVGGIENPAVGDVFDGVTVGKRVPSPWSKTSGAGISMIWFLGKEAQPLKISTTESMVK